MTGLWKGDLVALHEGKPRAAGKSPAHHDPLPVSARLLPGEPLRVVTERVAMQGRTLRWLVGRIDETRPYYLLGEVEMADARAQARSPC